MKSYGRHVPILVFLFGIGMLLLAMRSFFYPQDAVPPVEIVTEAPTAIGAPAIRTASRLRQVQAAPAARPDEIRAILNDQAHRLARGHLAELGLQMSLPDGMQFGSQAYGGVKTLLGSNGPAKVGFYLFSTTGAGFPPGAVDFLKDYFKGETDLYVKAQGTPYNNRAGFPDMTFYKGSTSKGEEIQVYFFRDKGRNKSHLLVLMDKQLSRHPAQVRRMVDSLNLLR